MERRHLQEGGEVVPIGRAVQCALGRVEGVHGLAQPDAVAHMAQETGRGSCGRRLIAGRLDQTLEVFGVMVDPLRVPGKASLSSSQEARPRMERSEVVESRASMSSTAGDAPRRAADRGPHVGPGDRGGVGGDPEVGQGSGRAGPVQQPGTDGAPAGNAGFGEQHLGGQERGVHPGQHGDVGRVGPVLAPAPHHLDGRRAELLAGDEADLESTVVHGQGGCPFPAVRGRVRGPDGLGNTPPVVREEVPGRRDHGCGTAVVDLEVVGRGPGEVAGKVDEEPGVGPGVAVDDLVVVAHAEHVGRRASHQPDQEQMGRGEVLELVDQERPGAGPHAAPAGPGRRVTGSTAR